MPRESHSRYGRIDSFENEVLTHVVNEHTEPKHTKCQRHRKELVKPRCFLNTQVVDNLIQDKGGSPQGSIISSRRQNTGLLLIVVIRRIYTVLVLGELYLVGVNIDYRLALDLPLVSGAITF